MGLLSRKSSKSGGDAPSGLVTTSITERVAVIRINNAAHTNVFTSNLVSDLTAAFEAISGNDDVGCVVLSAEGVHFSAGPSLAELAGFTKSDAQTYWRAGKRLTDAIEGARQPVVCAIQGSCVSVGLAVALACDIRLAADNAMLSFPDIRHIQLVPGWGATQRLTHMIGSQEAKYLLITGAPLNAEEAKRRGLVHDVSTPTQLDADAREMAVRIAASAPLVVLEQTKHTVDGGVDVEYGTAMRIEEQAYLTSWDIETRKDVLSDAQRRLNDGK